VNGKPCGKQELNKLARQRSIYQLMEVVMAQLVPATVKLVGVKLPSLLPRIIPTLTGGHPTFIAAHVPMSTRPEKLLAE
jgi:hypothetical protein